MHTAGAGLREIRGPAANVSGAALLRAVLVGVRADDLAGAVWLLDFSEPSNSGYLAVLGA